MSKVRGARDGPFYFLPAPIEGHQATIEQEHDIVDKGIEAAIELAQGDDVRNDRHPQPRLVAFRKRTHECRPLTPHRRPPAPPTPRC